jgi:hypothetical protein
MTESGYDTRVSWTGRVFVSSGGTERPFGRYGRALAGLLLAFGVMWLPATAHASYDTFDLETLNQTAGGQEIPFVSATSTPLRAEYDSGGFTLQPAEAPHFTGCTYRTGGGEERVYFGGRSAWVRFLPGVDGTINVKVNTFDKSGYVPMLSVYSGGPARGAENIGELHYLNCIADEEEGTRRNDKGVISEPAIHVQHGLPVQIQTLSVCGNVAEEGHPIPPELCHEGALVGGPTVVEVEFTPTDTDRDGVPDTLDQCPTVAGSLPDGCLPPTDYDGDGVPDSQDLCPSEPGPVSLGGCPDSDGDGIANIHDACPSAAGPASLGGCPDSDGDGIADNRDACPHQKGPTATAGCPDSDGDGIADNRDACPTEYADKSISLVGDGRPGCPEPLDAQLPFSFGIATNRGALLTSFNVDAPLGSRVVLGCHGRLCPRSFPIAVAETTKPLTRLLPLLHRGHLRRGRSVWIPVGTTISATVSRRGALGLRRTLRPRDDSQPARLDTCVTSSGASKKCPA